MLNFLAARSPNVFRFLRRLAPLWVILLGLWSARLLIGTIPPDNTVNFQVSPLVNDGSTDDDSVRTRIGLDAKPDFRSTFAFWVGNWTQGEMGPPTPFGPYFRPLTSQLWWIERAWSGGSLRFFLLIHLAWHLAFCLALWAVLKMLWGEHAALLIIVIWTLGVASLNGYSTLHDALLMWKDDPEMTVGLCVLGAMASIWRFAQTGERKFVVLGALSFTLGLSFKESAYVTPFFVALTLWHAGQLRARWRVVALFLGLAVIFYGYRTVVLQGMGGYHGTNASWRQRAFAENFAGSQTLSFFTGNALGMALACAVLALALWRLEKPRAAWTWSFVGVCLALWSEWNYHLSQGQWGISLLRLSNVFDWTGTPYQQVPLALLFVAGIQFFLMRRPPLMVWGYAWVLVAYLPLLHHVVTGHGFYFHSVGWAIFLAGAVLDLCGTPARRAATRRNMCKIFGFQTRKKSPKSAVSTALFATPKRPLRVPAPSFPGPPRYQ